MNLELAGVAERLVQEFPALPTLAVIDAVCACAGQCAAAGPFFIEQAARARLAAREREVTGPATAPVVIPEQPRAPGAADGRVARPDRGPGTSTAPA